MDGFENAREKEIDFNLLTHLQGLVQLQTNSSGTQVVHMPFFWRAIAMNNHSRNISSQSKAFSHASFIGTVGFKGLHC